MYSERIKFRNWGYEDLDKANILWGNVEVTKYIGGPFTHDQIETRLKTEIENYGKFKVQYWPMFLIADDAFIGCCGLRPRDIAKNIWELGFHVCRAYWGNGYAAEAAKRTMKYAFEELGIEELFAGHNPMNEKSKKILAVLGFEYTHGEYYPPTGLCHPSYRIVKAEYDTRGH